MSYQYELIDGHRVEKNVARDFRRMAKKFKEVTNESLHVRSGTRTDAEQERIFRERYVTAGNINGRRVYDTRVWRGVRWYRISPLGTVAVPGMSNHQESGPNGPRSVDVYDSGNDWGVTRRNTVRDKWMERHARDFEFENEGYLFGEPWHKTYRGEIGDYEKPLLPTQRLVTSELLNRRERPTTKSKLAGKGLKKGTVGNFVGWQRGESVSGNNVWLKGISGDWFWSGGVKGGASTHGLKDLNPRPAPTYPTASVATVGRIGNVEGLQKIARLNGGSTKVDNIWGAGSQRGLQNFLNARYGGSLTRWLRERWGYVGNDKQGPVMEAALRRANAENRKAL